MTLEQFTKRQAPGKPELTVRKRGALCLNRKAVEDFKLNEVRFVTLFYDRTERLLGIKPEKTAVASSFKISKEKNQSSVISCLRFLKHFGIPYERSSKTYPACWDEDRGMVIVKLG